MKKPLSGHAKAGAKGKAQKATPSHVEMNSRFRTFGRLAVSRVGGKAGKVTLANPAGHKEHYFKKLVDGLVQGEELKAKTFNARYRAALDHHDELVSTSSVREIVFGALKAHPTLAPAKLTEVDRVLDNVSKIRLPTYLVGHAISATKRMQHPTAAGTGFFAEAAQTASAHAQHDTARKAAVLSAIEDETKKSGWSLESAANAGARAAIAYTLNDMAAPVTASDVKPFSRMKTMSDTALIPAVETRESMKAVFVKLGGIQEPLTPGETANARLTRAWVGRMGKNNLRSVSPSRLPP